MRKTDIAFIIIVIIIKISIAVLGDEPRYSRIVTQALYHLGHDEVKSWFALWLNLVP